MSPYKIFTFDSSPKEHHDWKDSEIHLRLATAKNWVAWEQWYFLCTLIVHSWSLLITQLEGHFPSMFIKKEKLCIGIKNIRLRGLHSKQKGFWDILEKTRFYYRRFLLWFSGLYISAPFNWKSTKLVRLIKNNPIFQWAFMVQVWNLNHFWD